MLNISEFEKNLRGYQRAWYCKEHYLEVIPEDEAEEESWESLGEYWADPSHWD